MPQPATNPRIVQFGLFELDLDARELRKSGIRIKLQDQPFHILAMLLERPGEIVTREELQKRLWTEDTFVDFDLSLNSAVKKLRQALSDDSDNPRFIETLYRRGYRFIGPVNGSALSNQIPMQIVNTIPSAPAQAISVKTPNRTRAPFLYGSLALLLVCAGFAVYRLIPSQPPRILGFTQITHDGLLKFGMVSDGERLYLMEYKDDHFVLAQVSAVGGETSALPTPFANVMIQGITPTGSALLVSSFEGTGKGQQSWLLPLPGGPPRRLADLRTDSAAWSPDGTQAVISAGGKIFAANSDLSAAREIANLKGSVTHLVFSPDGRRLRFDLSDPGNTFDAIWEMAPDGSHLRQILPGWNSIPHECCGSWTPDGKYFVFASVRGGHLNIWALLEQSSWFARTPKPVQLTNGPLDFHAPLVSKDGKRIFVVGSQPRCEVVRYDSSSGFTRYLNGVSIQDLAFSPDGKWVAYVSVPAHQLWRSRLDGSERLQLTPDGMFVALPRWSPNGKQLAFMAASLDTSLQTYLVSDDGSGLHQLIPGNRTSYDPDWSPDGKFIVFTPEEGGEPDSRVPHAGIFVYDLQDGKISTLPDSTQFFSPRWSPDGRHIAALTNDSLKLMLFDRSNQKWQELVSLPIGYPSWSHNGQYIYFDTTLNEDPAFYRVRISDHKLERLTSLKGVQRFWGEFGPWTGLAPDDSLLLVRDTSSQEIYALDWQAP